MSVVVIAEPAPFEVSTGAVRGRVQRSATDVAVYLRDGRKVRLLARAGVSGAGAFAVRPTGLPVGDHRLVVVAYRAGTRVGSAAVTPVFGLPRRALQTRSPLRTDAYLQERLARLHGPGITAVWLRGLASGVAASANAGARFTGASTLKLAVLMTSLSRSADDPTRGPLWATYRLMIGASDNAAANAVERAFGGSTGGGSALVNAFCHAIGCRDTDMYGGYLTEEAPSGRAAPREIPPAVSDRVPPVAEYGKHTTARDLGLLATSLVEAATGHGPAHRAGVSGREARVALWLLVHTSYPGLVRPNAPSFAVAHKAGWGSDVEHDAAIIFTGTGPVVVVVLTQGGGVGPTASGRFARTVLHRGLHRIR
jgi:beta-lactamase class A